MKLVRNMMTAVLIALGLFMTTTGYQVASAEAHPGHAHEGQPGIVGCDRRHDCPPPTPVDEPDYEYWMSTPEFIHIFW